MNKCYYFNSIFLFVNFCKVINNITMALDDRYIDLRHFTEVKNSDGTSENKPYSHVVISDKEPTDTSVLWLDTTDSVDAETLDNATIDAIYKSINRLTNRVNAVEERFTHGINLGGFSNNVKEFATNVEEQEPETIEWESDPFVDSNNKILTNYKVKIKKLQQNGIYRLIIINTTEKILLDDNYTPTDTKTVITETTTQLYGDELDVYNSQQSLETFLETYSGEAFSNKLSTISTNYIKEVITEYYKTIELDNDSVYSLLSNKAFDENNGIGYEYGLNQYEENYNNIVKEVETNGERISKIVIKDSFKKTQTVNNGVSSPEKFEYDTRNIIVTSTTNSENQNTDNKFFNLPYIVSKDNGTEVETEVKQLADSLVVTIPKNILFSKNRTYVYVISQDKKSDTSEIEYKYELITKQEERFAQIKKYLKENHQLLANTENNNEKYSDEETDQYEEYTYREIFEYKIIAGSEETILPDKKQHIITEITKLLDEETKTEFIITTTVKTLEVVKNNQILQGIDPSNNYILLNDGIVVKKDVKIISNDLLLAEEANARHLVIKFGTKYELDTKFASDPNMFAAGELLYTYDTDELYVKHPKDNSLILLTKSSGADIDFSDIDLSNIQQLTFKYPAKKQTDNVIKYDSYITKINSKGELISYQDIEMDRPPNKNLYLQKLYINSVFCGGKFADKFTFTNSCDYNFVELSNLTEKDIKLDNISLYYTDKKYLWNGKSFIWKKLQLEGVIKSQGTLLIRGAQCAPTNLNTTYIKVPEPDINWYDNETGELIKFCNETPVFILLDNSVDINKINGSNSIKEDTNPITGYIDLVGFNDKISEGTNMSMNENKLYVKYYSMDKVKQATKAFSARNNLNDWTYVDLSNVDEASGINSVGIKVTDYIPQPSNTNKNLFYNKTKLLDNVDQDLIACTFGYNATDYTKYPAGSYKTYNELLSGYSEDWLTFQNEYSKNNVHKTATRCFNWVSKGYYNEYLWFREKSTTNTTTWNIVESFKNTSNTPSKYQFPEYYRQTFVAVDNTPCVSHKLVINGFTADHDSKKVYEYCVSRYSKSVDGNLPSDVNEGDLRTFTIKNAYESNIVTAEMICPKFIHVTDQQGFNHDEYEVWRQTAEVINNYSGEQLQPFDFVLNTGDHTQNGNRLSEWIDYFKGGKCLFKNHEQVSTVGNNDLCGKTWQGLEGVLDYNDEGLAKYNDKLFNLFFTYDYYSDNTDNTTSNRPLILTNDLAKDYNIDAASISNKFVPSLYAFNFGNTNFICANSEITDSIITYCYRNIDISKYKKFTSDEDATNNNYIKACVKSLRDWYCKELDRATNDNKIKIVFCHESPFTIITIDTLAKFKDNTGKYPQKDTDNTDNLPLRGGSKLNTLGAPLGTNMTLWFSRLLDYAGVKLCLCGHKHTFSLTHLLRENYEFSTENSDLNAVLNALNIIETDPLKSLKRINAICNHYQNPNIVANRLSLQTIMDDIKVGESYSLAPYKVNMSLINVENSYTISNFNTTSEGLTNILGLDSENGSDPNYCKEISNSTIFTAYNGYTLEPSCNPPCYCMLQATGYKHTSNKELPSPYIYWLAAYICAGKYTFDDNNNKVTTTSAGYLQKYPFYGYWECNSSLTGKIYKIDNIFAVDGVKSNGKFKINEQNPYTNLRIEVIPEINL